MTRAPLDPQTLVREAACIARLARRLLHDPDRAADAAQETLRVALERGPRPGFAPAAWLRGVLRNVVRRLRRGEARRWARERAAALPEAAPAEAAAERLAQRRAVIDAVLALPEDLRTAVELRFFEGLAPRLMGRRLGIPTETARSRVRRALATLRARLDQQAGGDGRRWAVALVPVTLRGQPWTAGHATPVAAASSAAARAVGGLLMAAKANVGIAATILLLLAALPWLLFRGSRDDDAPRAADERPSPEGSAPVTLTSGAGRGRAPVASPTPPTSPRLMVTGLVTDGEGRPLPGAAIHASSADEFADRARRPDVVTDGDGRFRLEREGSTLAWRISASLAGRRSASATATAGVPRDVVLRLALAIPLWLAVVDEASGRPVAGALVALTQADEGAIGVQRTTTDAEGLSELEETGVRAMDFEAAAAVSVTAAGYAPRIVVLDTRVVPGVTTPDHPLRVALSRAALHVRVTDAVGRPVEGAVVQGWGGVWTVGNVSGGSSLRKVPAELPGIEPTRTGPTGEASLAMPMDPWYVHVTSGVDSALVTGSGVPRPAAPVRLAPGLTVQGVVVGQDALPVAGTPVSVNWFSWFLVDPTRDRVPLPPPGLVAAFTVQAGSDGSFSIPGVPRRRDGQPFWVEVRTESAYGSALVAPAPDASRATVRIVLAPRRVLGLVLVSVRDEAGAPIPGAFVEVPNMNPGAWSDATGTAQLEIDADTVAARGLRVTAPGYATAMVAGADVRAPGPTTVVLEGEAVLDLLVRAPDGRGVATAQVAVVLDGPDAATLAALDDRGSPRRLAQGLSDAGGRMRVEGLPRRPIRIAAELFDPAAAASANGERNRAVLALPIPGAAEIVLPRNPFDPALGQVVEGLVLEEDGRPLVGAATAALQSATLGRNLTAPVAGGRFRFDGVPPGRWQLQIHAGVSQTPILADVEVTAGTDQRDLRVARTAPGRVVGVLTSESGEALGGIPIQALDLRGMRHVRARTTTREDGGFELEDLPAGRYEVVLRAPPFPRTAVRPIEGGSVEVAAGAEVRIEVRTVPAARLVLLCEDERIAPHPEGPLTNEDLQSTEMLTNVRLAGPSGTFRTEFGFYRGRNDGPWSLPPGRYRLTIRRFDGLLAEADVHVRGAGVVEVEVHFPPKPR